jgi:hypothetical protein
VPGREQGTILASMTLRRCDVSDAAVPMFIVVPMDEGPGPLSCRVEFGETTPCSRHQPLRADWFIAAVASPPTLQRCDTDPDRL